MPDVGKIFVLIKAKNEEAAMERLKNEVSYVLFFKYYVYISIIIILIHGFFVFDY